MSSQPFQPQGSPKPFPYRILPTDPWGPPPLLLVLQGPSFASLSTCPPGECLKLCTHLGPHPLHPLEVWDCGFFSLG